MTAYKDTIVFPIEGKIDVDNDVRRIKKGDIIDAFNCRWGVKNDGEGYAIQNVKGNELLDINLPVGTNKVIGACADFPNNSIIAFLYNSKNNHCILKVDMQLKEVSPILWEESLLGFSENFIINAGVMDGILYYLDTNVELKNLIIEKAEKYTNISYNEGIGYWIIETDFEVQP